MCGGEDTLDGMTVRLKNKQIKDTYPVFSRSEDILKPISFIVSKIATNVDKSYAKRQILCSVGNFTSVFQLVFNAVK